MLQTCFQLLWEFSSGISPNFLGLPFSYLQPRLPFSYYVMERAAKACEEPENTWNDQKLRYFKFSSLSHPGSSKSRFCWISLFFLALRAPQVVVFLGSMRCKSGSANKFNHHASCVLPPSHLRISLQFKLHQERIRICNPQKNVLWEIILDWRCPALIKNQCGQLPGPSIQLALETNSKTYKDQMLTIENSLEAHERNMGEILRKKGKYERLGKPLQERARLNTISWDFSRGEIIFGVLEMPCTSQKTAARATQLAQRLGKKLKNKCLPFPTHSHRLFWQDMKGIWEK